MKIVPFLLCWAAFCGITVTLQAQQNPKWQALNYQAVAMDENGKPLKNRSVVLRVSLVGTDNAAVPFFTEKHQTATDESGAFQILIGRGDLLAGDWSSVPWEKESVWLKVELAQKDQQNFDLISNKQLLAVPYAFHAATANNLLLPSQSGLEKGQSIYWTSSGNSGTRPPTHFLGTTDNQNLTFRANNIPFVTLTTQGKLELISQVPAGSDKDIKNYPMVVKGKYNTQGMWIKINGSRSNANNFMTFVDDNGIQGRIEGQTLSELEKSEIYITQAELFALTTVSIGGEIAALTIDGLGKCSSPWSALGCVAALLKLSNLVAKAASLVLAYSTWLDGVRKKVGVTFSSGNGDYAEWLQRMPGVRDLKFGEVVGVRGGQISLNTKNADHLMVVSKAPIVLGNAPQPDKEHLFEKVAFMGQIPVKVAGAVALNDYILPSGNNDGLAIAVHPKDMKTLDYGRILGVAWEAAIDRPINYVNVAVGINSNDLAPRVDALSSKVEQIESYLLAVNNQQAMKANSNSAPSTLRSGATTFQKLMTDAEFDQYLDKNESSFKNTYAQIRSQLEAQNIPYDSNPYMVKLFDNPIETLKQLRRNPAYTTQWGMIDQKIQSGK